jgi:hypothetical protein
MRKFDKLQLKLWLCVAFGCLLTGTMAAWVHPALAVVVLAAGLIVANVVYLMKLSCPKCKGSLLLSPDSGYLKRQIPDKCPHCGTVVD